MDDFRAELDSCGVGGIKCTCCRPPKRAKARWTRHTRRVLRRRVREMIENELETMQRPNDLFACSRCGDLALESERAEGTTECIFC